MEIDERKQKILWAIIQDYIASAEPVGSRTLSRKFNLGVSPATIRNEMADLEDMGLIEQPHTSAGRIPSDIGYRYYVDHLMEPFTLNPEERERIRTEIALRVSEAEDAFEYIVRLVSQITNLASIMLDSQNRQSNLKKIYFLPYEPGQAILVTVKDNGKVDNAVVDIGKETSAEDLQFLANLFNAKINDTPMSLLKQALLQEARSELQRKRQVFDYVLTRLENVLERSDEGVDERIYLSGALNMLNQPEFRNLDKFKNLFGVFEEYQKMRGLLLRGSQGLRVQIGSENQDEVFKGCSLITATYHIDGIPMGSFGVLGPTRMDYSRAVAIVKLVTDSLTHVFSRQAFKT